MWSLRHSCNKHVRVNSRFIPIYVNRLLYIALFNVNVKKDFSQDKEENLYSSTSNYNEFNLCTFSITQRHST